MASNFNLKLQDYKHSLTHSTIKLYAAVVGLFASVILLIVAVIISKKLNVSDAIAIIPLMVAVLPILWLLRYNRITKRFAQDIIQELKLRMSKQKELGQIKFAICDFLHELFGAEAVKLQIDNSIPVTQPAGVDPNFDMSGSIRWLRSEINQSGEPRKIIAGRFENKDPFANHHIARMRIDLTEKIHLGHLILVTRKGLSSDKQTLLSLIEDEIDTWIMCAIERYSIQFIINVVREIDEIANSIDSGTCAIPDAITQLLERLMTVTSSRSIFAELINRRWQGINNVDTWQNQEWEHISGMYGKCKNKFSDAGYEQVERFKVPWKPYSGEMILLPIYFDAAEQHLGYLVFQADQFEVGVEKALGQVEDLVLDNLIFRMVMDKQD